jgi:hypothetical protein
MHASTRNLVTCASGDCHEPATVNMLERRPTESITLAVDGRVYFYEQAAAIVDYCPVHAIEACE